MQGVPCATMMQAVPRFLHSMQTLFGDTFGLRSFKNALMTSRSWCLLIGQPRSSKSTITCAAMGVDVSSVLMYSGLA